MIAVDSASCECENYLMNGKYIRRDLCHDRLACPPNPWRFTFEHVNPNLS